ncbi:hypothetical protein DVH05_022200 [Phytophthora capsici]|nr:hypothetical protein DVH05_022200 [Phytophthora capsici]
MRVSSRVRDGRSSESRGTRERDELEDRHPAERRYVADLHDQPEKLVDRRQDRVGRCENGCASTGGAAPSQTGLSGIGHVASDSYAATIISRRELLAVPPPQ